MRAGHVDSLRATDETGLLAPLKDHETRENVPPNIRTKKNGNTKTPAHERRTRMAECPQKRDSPDDDEWKIGWEPRQAPPSSSPVGDCHKRSQEASANPPTATGKSPLMTTQPPSPLTGPSLAGSTTATTRIPHWCG